MPLRFGFAVLLLFSSAVSAASQDTISQLAKIRLDRTQIYSVRDITINRDVLSISLNRGTLAFTEPVHGKVTGAVFIGSGDVLAIPPDRIEKQQLYRYTKSALLSERFETAVFRFTDTSYEEILKEHRKHAEETVDAADIDQILRWESEIQRRAVFLNDRLLSDLIGAAGRPFFMAQIEGSQLGWFDAIYDERRVEEVLLQQNLALADAPIVWSSFNKRSEVRDPASFAHEDKSQFDIMSIDPGGTQVNLRARVDGERVLGLPLPSYGVVSVELADGTALPFLPSGDHVAVVLPAPTRSGAEIALRIGYASDARPPIPAGLVNTTDALFPASYRDQWIIEAFSRYASALANPATFPQARDQLLAVSPEGGSFESLGPVWIGFRLMQPRTNPSYAEAFSAKSVWILHMLRQVLQREGGAPAFGRMVDEIQTEFRGKPFSTYDLKRLAEKHAGKPLDWFFDSWIFGMGIPAYSVSFKVDPDPGGFAISGNITQSGVPDTFEMLVPVYADETYLGHVTVSSDGGEFRFVTSNKPQQVLVDPRRTLLTRAN